MKKEKEEYYDVFKKEIDRIRSKGRRYYIEGLKNHKFDSPKSVLKTLYDMGSERTYHTGGSQQDTGRYRSFPDLYKVVLFYFPDATPLDVVKGFRVGNSLSSRAALNPSYCPDVRKVVYSYPSTWADPFYLPDDSGLGVPSMYVPEFSQRYQEDYSKK